MLPVATGTIAFLIVEGIYLNTIYNLEAGFLPAIGAAVIVGAATSIHLARRDAARDAPTPTKYNVPAPLAIATVKRVLKTYYHGRNRWRINYDDRQSGEIQASITLIDDSYSDMRWLVPSGKVEKSINAHIAIIPQPKSVSEVHIDWIVDAPLSRSDCNAIIDETSQLIHDALCAADASRQGKRATQYEE